MYIVCIIGNATATRVQILDETDCILQNVEIIYISYIIWYHIYIYMRSIYWIVWGGLVEYRLDFQFWKNSRILGSRRPQAFLWGREAVIFNYCTVGVPSKLHSPTHSYNTIRHSSFTRYAAATKMPHLLCEKSPTLKHWMKLHDFINKELYIYIYIYYIYIYIYIYI